MIVGRNLTDIHIQMDMSNKTCRFIVESAIKGHTSTRFDVATNALLALTVLALEQHSITSNPDKENTKDDLMNWSDMTEYPN